MDENSACDEAEMVENSNRKDLVVYNEEYSDTEPRVGMKFDSEEAAKVFYDAYATRLGFVMRVDAFQRSMRDGKVVWRRLVCNKEGFHKCRPRQSESRKPRAITREGCKAMIVVKQEKTGKWVVTKFFEEHNHPLVVAAANTRRSALLSQTPLGAGTSLPGMVAAKVGADVTLTDDSNRSEVLDNMRRVCVLNDLTCKVLGLTWGVWDEPIFSLFPTIILGADVLYDTSAFDDLFATMTFLLQKCPDSIFMTTYHNRSGHHLLEFLMVKWGLKCTKLLDGYSFMPSHKASSLSGNIQLAEIVLDAPN